MTQPRKFLPVFLSLILLLMAKGCSPNPPTPQKNAASVKIFAAQEGIYRISARELGWAEIPSELSLSLRGDAQPFWIEEENDLSTLYFYAPEANDLHTKYTILILTPGKSDPLRPTEKYQTSVSPPSTSYTAYIHLEENTTYQPLALENLWLGQRIIAPQTLSIPINLANVSAGLGILQVNLWGNTQAPTKPDHHIQLTLNGQLIADQTWDGQNTLAISAPIPENLLSEGENTLEITAPGDTEAAVDIIFLDWVEIAYPRVSQASNDVLFFNGDPKPLAMSGFSAAPVIFDVTAIPAAKRLVAADSQAETIFQGEPDHRYIAVGPQGYLSPAKIEPLTTLPDLRASDQGADYLAIGPADLLDPLTPLLTRRQAQGLSAQAIPAQAVYDQFGDGFPTPLAIRRFLQYAAQNWDPAPKYVLLVGDATYDPKGYQFSNEGHHLPTMPVDTTHGGQTGSDIPLAQLDDSAEDPWPDLALGRIPARTAAQVQIFVDKTIAYEEGSPSAEWRQRIFAIADGQEASFQEDAQAFLDHFAAPYQSTLLATEAGAPDIHQEIQTRLEEGVFIAAYYGHGSLVMWGKDKLFTTENVAELKNIERLPIILNFTCLTGLFTHPTVESFAESLLWNPRGGAVAVLAPSSLTLSSSQSALSDALAEGFLDASSRRLGDIVLQAWRQVPADTLDSQDVMLTFMLFGDPGLVISEESSVNSVQ